MLWTCERQVAGDLIKERRFICAARRKGDSVAETKAKGDIRQRVRQSGFRRTPTDRLELMLGVMGFDSSMYTLTFADEYLPKSFKAVSKEWTNFLERLRRAAGCASIDYIRVIEGAHGEHRYHIHAVFNNAQVSIKHVQMAWGGGLMVDARKIDQSGSVFIDFARYLTKERSDGVVHPLGSRPWSASQSLYKRLPAPERWKDDSGYIEEPEGYRIVPGSFTSLENEFGRFRYCAFWRRRALSISK